jgi:hypothetical protein
MSENNLVFNVGQIFFVVFNNKTEIYPFRIIERTTTQKMSGEEVVYKCECPKFEKQVFAVSEIYNKGGKIFLDIEEVKKFLLAKVTSAVEQIVSSAIDMVRKNFGVYEQDTVNTLDSHELEEETDETTVRVLMPDNTYVNAKIKQQ